ncbi:MAG: BMP family ABC transporter substrate-binding protein [Chloroflexi bacterium]|nr:MAG: BMP family ABC transporter substrate-binding protein [Chloroflexota bacterium]
MKRLFALGLAVGLVIAGCGGGGLLGGGLKIGMVTDIGQLEDKSFNEFSWKGVQDGASAVGGTAKNIVTKDIADYKQNIQSFVDQKYDVIVTVGFLIGTDTLAAAKANPIRGRPVRRRSCACELSGAHLQRGAGRVPRGHRRREYHQDEQGRCGWRTVGRSTGRELHQGLPERGEVHEGRGHRHRQLCRGLQRS